MTSSSDRLDRMEDDLDTVKDILLTVARRYEDAEERMKASDRRIDQTTANIDKLSATVNQLATEAKAGRIVMYEMLDQLTTVRDENKRILDYLFGQQRGNGHGDQPQ